MTKTNTLPAAIYALIALSPLLLELWAPATNWSPAYFAAGTASALAALHAKELQRRLAYLKVLKKHMANHRRLMAEAANDAREYAIQQELHNDRVEEYNALRPWFIHKVEAA